jgi:hypothetical protein
MTGLILPMVAVVLIVDIPDDLFEDVDHGRTIAECGHQDRHLTPSSPASSRNHRNTARAPCPVPAERRHCALRLSCVT